MERGLDLNMWNTTTYNVVQSKRPYVGPDVRKLKLRQVKFVTLRASAGDYVDWAFERNYETLKNAGIDIVMYHWFNPKIEWNIQAQTFMHAIGSLPDKKMIDLEDTRTIKAYRGIFTKVKTYLNATNTEYIYLNPDFMSLYWNKETWLDQYPLLIAHWGAVAPTVPKPWSPNLWYAWQYTAKENGISFGLTTEGAAPYVR